MINDAHKHRMVVTIEDGIAEGGVGSAIAEKLQRVLGETPQVHVLGIPVSFVPQGNPENLLSSFGLDARGLEETVLRNL